MIVDYLAQNLGAAAANLDLLRALGRGTAVRANSIGEAPAPPDETNAAAPAEPAPASVTFSEHDLRARIAALEAQVEDYRRQLATVIERAVSRNRNLGRRQPRSTNRPKPPTKPTRRVIPKKPARRPKSKGRAKR